MTANPLQLFPRLDAATEAALRASIERFGVLVPVARDQHGRTLDGHHRSRLADDLGVDYRVDTIRVESDEQAREIAATLNTNRRPQLTGAQLREVMVTLLNQKRADGVGVHSMNAIAGALGISETHARRIADELRPTAKLDEVTRRVGQDGKVRPARKPITIPANSAKRGADRAAQAALNLPDEVETAVLDVKRAERITREKATADLRAKHAAAVTTHDDIEIRTGDFQEVLVDLAGQVDAIITDPPYPAEFIDLFYGLSLLGANLLTDDGTLVAMTGQSHLPAYIERLGSNLTYRWCGAYMTPGVATRISQRQVGTRWKPILIYDKNGGRPFIGSDVWTSQGDDKDHHHWGQSESGITALVEAFTRPGDLVVDPFLGGGTTAVVCKALGRRFVGCDTDTAAIHTTNERLAG